jgi:hypothetical protein
MMQELSAGELEALVGGSWGDFLGGLSCGIALVGAAALAVSPDPITKAALVSVGGTVAGCVAYFVS